MILDKTDKNIQKSIQTVTSMSVSEIPEKVNFTQPPC